MISGKTFLLNALLIFTAIACKSQTEQKADINLVGKNCEFGNEIKIVQRNIKSSNVKFNGRKCLKAVSTSKPSNTHYVHFSPVTLPLTLNAHRFYTSSVYICTQDGAQGRFALEVYNKKKKYIKTYKTKYVSSKKWKKIKIGFYPPEENCSIRPIFFSKNGQGAVCWNKFDIRFASKPQLLYFRKKDKGMLNIHGTIDPAYIPEISVKSELSAEISLKDPLNKKVLFTVTCPLNKHKLSANINLSKYDLGIYRFDIMIKNMGKTVFKTKMTYVPGLDCAYKEMESFNKQVNSEVGVDVKEAEKINSDKKERERGFILFNRPEPRWIQPDSLPLPNERTKVFKRTAAPGDYIFFTTALLPLVDLKDVEFSFLPENKNFPESQTGMLRYMPQQTNYSYKDNIKKYWIIPEVIDEVKPADLKQGRIQQYSLRLKVTKNAKGRYSGKCLIKVKKKILAQIPVEIKVIPVRLSQPDDVVFGIYTDQIRWVRNEKEYTETKILEELKDMREHGYNSILLEAAPPVIKVSFKNGYYKVDTKHLSKILKLCAKAGFNKQPFILSTYAMERIITPIVGLPAPKGSKYTPEYKKYVDQFFEQIRNATVKAGLPETLIQGVDESSHGERLQRSIRKLSVAKEHGFRTTCTMYHWSLERTPEYDKMLDFRTYSCVGFWEMRTPEITKKIRKDTAEKGDVFWSYGSGCYANFNHPGRPFFRNTRQEGCLTENRYMHGIFMYRAKLKGEWSWTFCRWRGSAENDFDDPHRFESKDAYIVFPNANRVGYKDTLQWEALRQGWQDYRAISTLDRLLAREKNKKAKKIKSEMNNKIAKIPWRNYTQYPNRKLNKLRKWILEKIYELKNKGGTFKRKTDK